MSTRDLVHEASDIVYARIMNGTASPSDRACYYVLSTSAVRLVPGLNTLEARDTARHIQESLAFTIVMHEDRKCERCGAPFKLIQECEVDGCVDPNDD